MFNFRLLFKEINTTNAKSLLFCLLFEVRPQVSIFLVSIISYWAKYKKVFSKMISLFHSHFWCKQHWIRYYLLKRKVEKKVILSSVTKWKVWKFQFILFICNLKEEERVDWIWLREKKKKWFSSRDSISKIRRNCVSFDSRNTFYFALWLLLLRPFIMFTILLFLLLFIFIGFYWKKKKKFCIPLYTVIFPKGFPVQTFAG